MSFPTSCPWRWGRWNTGRTSRCTSARSTTRPGRTAIRSSTFSPPGSAPPEEERPVKRHVAEARFTAQRIRQLLEEGYEVTGSGGALRPCRPEDIVILMRSPGSRAAEYARALAEHGIPCSFEASENFFKTMEIAVTLSLLEVIDNPRQDVPLISVLRSPVFGFSPDRLAEIRSADREGDFYDALCADGGADTRDFLAALEQLRQTAADRSVCRLLWQPL